MIDCTATLNAYDTVHICNLPRHGDDGTHQCLCGITWTWTQ